jgi:hypothetical protein
MARTLLYHSSLPRSVAATAKSDRSSDAVGYFYIDDSYGSSCAPYVCTREQIGVLSWSQVVDAKIDGGHAVSEYRHERIVARDVDQTCDHPAVKLVCAVSALYLRPVEAAEQYGASFEIEALQFESQQPLKGTLIERSL